MHQSERTEQAQVEDGSVRIVSPRPGPAPPGGRRGAPPPWWARYALPATALGLLLALVLTDTDTLTTEASEGVAPPTASPSAEPVEASAVTAPEDVPMAWDAFPILDSRIVGITAEGALAAVVGSGSTLIDPLSLEGPTVPVIHATDPGASSPFLFADVLGSREMSLIVGHDPATNRAILWRPAIGTRRPVSYLPDLRAGLENIVGVTGAASNNRSSLIVGEHAKGLPQVWVMRAGDVWEEHAPRNLVDPRPRVVVAVGDIYFLGGARCVPDCVPAIWTSDDGITWVAGTGVGRDAPGRVTGIAATGAAIYAVGTMENGSGASWVSHDDGLTWEREHDAGLEERVVVTLEGIGERPGGAPTARLRVDGEVVEVAEGGSIATRIGDVPVRELGSVAVLVVDGETHALRVGEEWTLRTRFDIEDVDAADGTLVAVGSRQRPNRIGRPVVWIREEGSSVWNPHPLPGATPPRHVLATEAGILVAGSSDPAADAAVESTVWITTYSFPEQEAAALAAVRSLLTAFESGESFPAVEALHRTLDAPIQVPGFAGLPFRLPNTGETFDPDPIIGAVRYTAALDTSITLTDCTTRALLTDPDGVRIACDYSASSALLQMLGLDVSSGRLVATTRDGRVTALEVTASEELAVWQSFETYTAGTYEGAAFSVFVTGRPSEATARAHLDAAARLSSASPRR